VVSVTGPYGRILGFLDKIIFIIIIIMKAGPGGNYNGILTAELPGTVLDILLKKVC
jgi:hypothetical protein